MAGIIVSEVHAGNAARAGRCACCPCQTIQRAERSRRPTWRNFKNATDGAFLNALNDLDANDPGTLPQAVATARGQTADISSQKTAPADAR